MTFTRIVLSLLLCCAGPRAGAVPTQAADESPPSAGSSAISATDGTTQPVDAAAIDADIANQQLSNAAQIRLEAARDSVVQIRGFYGGSESGAFHGTGFAASDDGMIVTNYHVVADAVLHPQQYRLEYTTADGRSGALHVYAVDVSHDLAVVRADDLRLPPLRLRTRIPAQGERAYSIGFPLNLGLTITEGVANGVVANSLEQRIHYTGAINSGMSGGPALDSKGKVYGVNVSVVTRRQLVGFVVPAKHIGPLLGRAREPLDRTHSPRQARALVAAQVLAHEDRILAAMPDKLVTQTVHGYTLPTRVSPNMECSTVAERGAHPQLDVERISCAIPAALLVQPGLAVAGISIQHRILRTHNLHPLQFTQQLNRQAAAYQRTGSAGHVAPFACEYALVSLDGFDARISTCARQYRLFPGLFDIAVTVVSINEPQRAVISQLDLRGVAFEPGMQFVTRSLGALRWTP